MSEQTDEQQQSSDTADNTSGFTPPASQDELNRIINDRLQRERAKYADYKDLKSKAGRLDELEAEKKTEVEKATERATAAEQRAAQAEAQAVRAEVASAKGVPASSLSGSTKEELEAAADELISWRDEANKSGTLNPRGGFQSGASKQSNGPLTKKQQAAAALRDMRKRD